MPNINTRGRIARSVRPRQAALAALCVVTLAGAACSSPAHTPASTPDALAGLSARSTQSYKDGMDQFSKGNYVDALNDFQQAKLLSPNDNQQVDAMLQKTQELLAPTATAVPSTPTPQPATPTPLPPAMSSATPDATLAATYFGKVFLAVVPASNVVPQPSNQFYIEDQIGMYIEGLGQRLRMPFTLRVYNLDTHALLATVENAGVPPTPSALAPVPGATPGTSPTQQGNHLVRFWNNLVWYHSGGEPAGHYRAELYSNATLASTLDYIVSTTPPAPTPTNTPIPSPTVAPPPAKPAAAPPAPASRPAAPARVSAPAPAPAKPTETPTPTPTPKPQPAASDVVGGLPAGIALQDSTDHVYVADPSGVLRTLNGAQPTLQRPMVLPAIPVNLALDQTTGYLFVATRQKPGIVAINPNTGQTLATIPLPGAPDLEAMDSTLGLLWVTIPEKQALAMVDVRSGTVRGMISGIHQVTGIAIDEDAHRVYLSQLPGIISTFDAQNGSLVGSANVTGPGLTGIATANGQVYAVNAPTHSLVAFDPSSGTVTPIPLDGEPAAVAAGANSSTVYVLLGKNHVVERIDPSSGTVMGIVTLADRSGNQSATAQQGGNFRGLEAQMLIKPDDETLYVSQPDSGTMSMISSDMFPPLPGQ